MARHLWMLRESWRVIRRRRMTIFLSACLAGVLSLGVAWQQGLRWEAAALIKFERSDSLTGLVADTVAGSGAESMETRAAVIRSFPVMVEVAKRLGELPQGASAEALKESRASIGIVDGLAAGIQARRVPNMDIIEIIASSAAPRRAKELANTAAEAYRDYQGRIRNARVIAARRFIEQQLKELEGRVRKAEEEVWEFRKAQGVVAPGAESSILLSLFTQVRSEIEKARAQQRELEAAASRLAGANGATDPEAGRVFVDTPNPVVARLQTSLGELLLERSTLTPELREDHPRLRAIDDRIREAQGEILRQITAQIRHLRSREEILTRQFGELSRRNREVPAIELSLGRLQREARTSDDLLALLKARHLETLIREAEKGDEVTIIRPAVEPSWPAAGRVFGTVLVGILIGLGAGLVLALVQESRGAAVGASGEIEEALGVPVLGVIPHIDARASVDRLLERRPALASMDPECLSRHALLVSQFDPASPLPAAFRRLRERLEFAVMHGQGRLLLVTSPTEAEGTTTTAVNLAIMLSQAGRKTLLVGANLRRPSIYKVFGIDRDPGLSDVLRGSASWEECVRTGADILMGRFEIEDVIAMPGLERLHVLEAGPASPDPAELFSPPRLTEFLEQVRQRYDVVLFDAPPILPVGDAVVLATRMDGVLLVARAGKVGRFVLKRAMIRLQDANTPVWGVVLNDLQDQTRDGASGETVGPVPGTYRRPAQRRVGILLLVALGLLLGALGGWRAGLFVPAGMTPVKELLRGPEAKPSPEPSAARGVSPAPGSAPVLASQQPRAAPPPRYALEFGPFLTAEEAKRVERDLHSASLGTVRFTQQGGANLFGVFVEELQSRRHAEATAEHLLVEGFSQPEIVGDEGNLSLRVGEPVPLRAAVEAALRLRGAGHKVRVALQSGEAITLMVRHGNFASEEEAHARSRDLAGRGLLNRVVRVK